MPRRSCGQPSGHDGTTPTRCASSTDALGQRPASPAARRQCLRIPLRAGWTGKPIRYAWARCAAPAVGPIRRGPRGAQGGAVTDLFDFLPAGRQAPRHRRVMEGAGSPPALSSGSNPSRRLLPRVDARWKGRRAGPRPRRRNRAWFGEGGAPRGGEHCCCRRGAPGT